MRNNFISFDASIREGILGIGIYDNLTFEHFTYYTDISKDCSFTGETIALGCALQYAYKIKRTVVNLYTDNKSVANNGIPKQLQHLVENMQVTLTWVPREMNKEADRASKGTVENSVKLTQARKNNLRKKHPQENKIQIVTSGPKKLFINHPFEEKIKLLKRVADNSIEHQEIIRLIESGERGDYKFQLNVNKPKITALAKLVHTIFDHQELSKYTNRRLKSSFNSAKIKQKLLTKDQLKSLVYPTEYK